MINFLGLNFSLLNKEDLLRDRESLTFVVTANAEIIINALENPKYKKIISKGELSFDGQIPFFLARRKNPRRIFEKLSGSDMIYDFCEKAHKEKRKVFLLGGLEESNVNAVMKLRELYPNALIEGYSPPFSPYPFNAELNSFIREKLTNFSPDYIFVGFGAGKQEEWIFDNYDFLSGLGTRAAIGSGGTFEFVSGKIKRAPRVLQRIGLEGVFRLLAQPQWFRIKRLLKSFKIFYYYMRHQAAVSSSV